jgi:hypothetical protein
VNKTFVIVIDNVINFMKVPIQVKTIIQIILFILKL